MVKQKPDDYLRVTFDLEAKDVTSAEKEATYQEIKNYINFRFGASVSTLYISQIKRKCGLPVKEAYNKPEVNKHHVPSCPAEKEFYIMDALRYFKMIS